jgi:transcription elongation factor GreA
MPDRTVYLTRDGFERLDAERRQLVDERRPAVAERLKLARDMTTILDNAENDDAKSEQSFVEGRIQDLDRLLANATIIEDIPSRDFVTLGSRVTVRGDGEDDTYFVVGSAEADPRRGRISNESPLGRALIGKRVGERAFVVAPGGSFEVEITAVG